MLSFICMYILRGQIQAFRDMQQKLDGELNKTASNSMSHMRVCECCCLCELVCIACHYNLNAFISVSSLVI